jgi:hypothetical protein
MCARFAASKNWCQKNGQKKKRNREHTFAELEVARQCQNLVDDTPIQVQQRESI